MKKLLAIIAAAVLVCGGAVTAYLAIDGRFSYPVPHDNSVFGSYVDNRNEQSVKTFMFDGKKITAKYKNSECLKDLPPEKRSDNYGNYDVYVTDNGAEFLFLVNSDLICGATNPNKGSIPALPSPNEVAAPIPEEKALKIAADYLTKLRPNAKEYVLLEHEYNESSGRFDIRYYLPICGKQSDDEFRIWISAYGDVEFYSEFNYKRYEKTQFSAEEIDRARAEVDAMIKDRNAKAEQGKTGFTYDLYNSYVSINDNGDRVLVCGIRTNEFNDKEGYVYYLTMYEQKL